MEIKNIIDYIEDKEILINGNWFYHATTFDMKIIEEILNFGITSAFLRKENSNGGYNGKYYVSLGKVADQSSEIHHNFSCFPTFILDKISPIKTSQNYFSLLYETILPFRYSSYCGEYHNFLKISVSKIKAMEYSLYSMLNRNQFDKSRLEFLKILIIYLEQNDFDIPIYDFSSEKEINKEKVLSLEI